MTNLDSILKSRDVTLPTKVCIVRALVLPVVMHGFVTQLSERTPPKPLGRCVWYVQETARRHAAGLEEEGRKNEKMKSERQQGVTIRTLGLLG